MKKGYWKGFVTGLLLTALVLGLGVSAGAAGWTIAVDGGSKVTVNGKSFTPKDSKGNTMEIFSYNGVTYVPLREFCKATGIEASYNANTKTEVLTTPDIYLPSEYITAEKAKELALAHAGVKAADAYFYEVKVRWTDSKPVYELGFYSGDIEYSYDVSAVNGAILGWNYWLVDNTYPNDYITVEKAKELALAHAGVKASNAAFFRSRLEWNSGKPVYEVGFESGKREYYYSIDAVKGTVLSWDYKDVGSGSQGGTQTNYITIERAKEIALSDAGVKAANATFTKVKFDWDDGRAEYEVEFYCNGAEYEYDIDAVSGKILDKDIDRDDDDDDDGWYGRHNNGNHYGWENGKGNHRGHSGWDWDD